MVIAGKTVKQPRLLAASIGGLILVDVIRIIIVWNSSIDWYKSLLKPTPTIPLWVFGPIGLILYICLGISLYLVLSAESQESKKSALIAFSLQVLLSIIWPLTFFIAHALWLSFGIIAVHIGITIWTMREFNGFHEAAIYLLFPHLVWLTFTSFLCLSVALLN